MLSLDSTHGGVDASALAKTITSLTAYREHLQRVARDPSFSEDESSVALPFTSTPSLSISRHLSPSLRFIIIIGIGGSNLGTMAVYDALFGKDDALRSRTPKMLFLDTVSTSALRAVESVLLRCTSQDEFAIFVISKSGATTETIANAEALHASLAALFPDVLHASPQLRTKALRYGSTQKNSV